MPDDAVMAKIMEGQQLHIAGDRHGARRVFAGLWQEIGADGDPLQRCSLAHFMADVQDDPAGELSWDLRALHAADELTDERATQYHSSLAVRGFYPSLHLNLAEDYRKLGDRAAAGRHIAAADDCLDALADDGYGAGLRAALEGCRQRLAADEENPG